LPFDVEAHIAGPSGFGMDLEKKVARGVQSSRSNLIAWLMCEIALHED
jgi:hypothetical protein